VSSIAVYFQKTFPKIDSLFILKLLYMIQAWIKISSNNDIDDDLKYCGEYNVENSINMDKLRLLENIETYDIALVKEKFERLAKYHKLFALYRFDETKITKELLLHSVRMIEPTTKLPKIHTIFRGNDSKRNEVRLEYEIAELSIKLLDMPEDSILFVPYTEGFGYVDYINNKISIEENRNVNEQEFLVELINLLENKMITLEPYIPFRDKFKSPYEYILSFPPQGQQSYRESNHLKYINNSRINLLDGYYFNDIVQNTEKKAVIMMSVKFAYRQSYHLMRKQLIQSNSLEAIIQLPPKLHGVTNSEMMLYVINKEKTSSNIQFINLVGEQFEKKLGRRKHLANIEDIIDIYKKKQKIEGVSIIATYKMLEENNFSLVLSKYFSKIETNSIVKKNKIFLEDFATIKKSQSFIDNEIGNLVYEISPSHFNKNGFTKECGKEIKLEAIEKIANYQLEQFDILVSSKGSIGKVAIIGDIKQTIIGSQAVHIIRVKKNKKYHAIALYMFLKSKNGQSALQQLTNGRVMPIISTAQFNKMEIPNFSDKQLIELVDNFNKQIELQKEINQVEQKIDKINNINL